MLSDIFTQGTLEMPTAAMNNIVGLVGWSDIRINKILVLVSIVLVLLVLKDIFSLLPYLFSCVDRPRGCYELEHRIGLARSRNLTAIICLLPFSLIVDKYNVCRPDFWIKIPAEWSAIATYSYVLLFFILRGLFFLFFKPKRLNQEARNTIHHCIFNFFILMTLLMVISDSILNIFRSSTQDFQVVFIVEVLAFFMLSLARTWQILGSKCSGLATFLYLCALEILPISIVASSIVFL